MSKKDDRIAELEVENARLQAENVRLNICLMNPPYFNVISPNRCGLCGSFLSDGYGPAHQCWQWTCTTANTDTYAATGVPVIGIMGRAG